MTGNSYGIPPGVALDMICTLCEKEYSKGKRKININRIWNIADRGRHYGNDTRACRTKTVPAPVSETSTETWE